MSQALHVPEELYAQFARYAHEKREDVDVAGTRLLAEALRAVEATHETTAAEPVDPFARLAGIISVDDPEAGLRHDEYFGYEDNHAEQP